MLIVSLPPSSALLYDEPLCVKCLHPLASHTYVLARLNGKEARRCGIGVCTCIVMVEK